MTATLTLTRLATDGVFDAVRRDPDALADGQLWRLVSPVLVQGDRSVYAVVVAFVLCAAIGVVGEQVLTRPRWLALYLVGALAGHGVGEVFQPHQSGTSVAFMGILGGVAAYALWRRPRGPVWHARAAVSLTLLAVLDTVGEDIHGPAFLAGLALGAVLVLRDRAHAPASMRSTTTG